MKKSIFTKIGERLRNKPDKKTRSSAEVRRKQTLNPKDEGKTKVAKLDRDLEPAIAEEKGLSESDAKDTEQDLAQSAPLTEVTAEPASDQLSEKSFEQETPLESDADNEEEGLRELDAEDETEKESDHFEAPADAASPIEEAALPEVIHDESDDTENYDYDFAPNLDDDMEMKEASAMSGTRDSGKAKDVSEDLPDSEKEEAEEDRASSDKSQEDDDGKTDDKAEKTEVTPEIESDGTQDDRAIEDENKETEEVDGPAEASKDHDDSSVFGKDDDEHENIDAAVTEPENVSDEAAQDEDIAGKTQNDDAGADDVKDDGSSKTDEAGETDDVNAEEDIKSEDTEKSIDETEEAEASSDEAEDEIDVEADESVETDDVNPEETESEAAETPAEEIEKAEASSDEAEDEIDVEADESAETDDVNPEETESEAAETPSDETEEAEANSDETENDVDIESEESITDDDGGLGEDIKSEDAEKPEAVSIIAEAADDVKDHDADQSESADDLSEDVKADDDQCESDVTSDHGEESPDDTEAESAEASDESEPAGAPEDTQFSESNEDIKAEDDNQSPSDEITEAPDDFDRPEDEIEKESDLTQASPDGKDPEAQDAAEEAAEDESQSPSDETTDAQAGEPEEDILSEVAASREAEDVSHDEHSEDGISEPTEELPIISGAMLGAAAAVSGLENDETEHSVALSDEELAALAEAESEPKSETETGETEAAQDQDALSESSQHEPVHEADVADFFAVPEVPEKDAISPQTEKAEDQTEVLPVSGAEDQTDQPDDAARAGRVIDLSEPDEESEAKSTSDDKKDQPAEKPQKKKTGKVVFGILAAIVGVLAICYAGGCFFYQNHFFFGTKISGVDASNKTAQAVENSIEKDAKDYKLTLKERENQSETIAAKDIGLRYSDDNPVQKALDKQNPFKWPLAVLGINDDELPTVYEYDEAKLNKKIQSLNAVSSMVNAENAHPAYSDGQIIIKGMIQGNEVDPKALTDAVKKAIAKGDETLDLEANKIYKNPTYGEDAQEVEAAKKVMEGYLKSEITYTIGETKEVLGKDQFGPWLKTDEGMNVYIDQVQAADWIHQNLGAKYDTAWGEHDFKNSAGQQMKVEGGNYGWEIDEAAELDQLMALIPSGQKNTHEPAWAQTALAGKGTHADIGNTYIEISLGSQHMWCYKDGKLVIDTDVVTGDVNLGRGTPAGVFYIYSMQENATLVGEDYRTPVAYWMPFNGGVGIHDSTWRGASEYGGTTYMGNGSHGCVNTPLDVVAVIFQNADVGEPVVVYY